LDSLLLQTEDLLLPKLAAGQRVRDLEKALEALAAYRRESDGAASLELRPLESDLRQIVRQLRADERQLARLHERLQAEVLRLRTSPVSSVVDALPRMVRDLAREAEKEVDLTITGTELELDRRVLERLKDPLIHLVRNAVDHGIEMPDIRERLKKPRRGRIAISFSPADNHRIEVSIQDDGAGVRLDDVRAAATRTRILSAEEAEGLDGRAAEELLFHSGFSTSPVVTRVSGHGLGLSIVRERVESIGGMLHLETIPEAGTTLRMLLPATIATFSGLLVRSGGQHFLFPLEAVNHVLRVPRTEIGSVEGRITIQREGQFLRAATLHSLLQLPPVEQPSEPERLPCVVLSMGEERLGVLVDDVLGERELLAKELEPPLARVPHVAGAGVLGTGKLVLILRPADLLRSASSTRPTPLKPAASARPQRQPIVLVVDDSITTRMMEKNLLESAGYTVHTAVDGMEAWTYLKSETCDLVVSDVDMPRMDGFELTTRIRGDAALRDLPVILVTAMESREHRERGVLAGANAYVIKSNFEESNLLEIIHRLL
jgi:two-component system chemotaxis sensor kinase CheA